MSFARQSLGSLLTLGFGVAVSVLLPRVLGPEARGEYQLAVKLAGLVLAVAQWGIPEVLLQLMADGRASTARLIGTSLSLGLAGAAVTAVVLGLAAPLLRDNLLRGVEPLLLWLTLAGSLASQLGLLCMFLGSEGGAFVLNANLDVATVGIYRVALSVSRLVLQVSIALRTALQPRLVTIEQDSAALTARVTRHGLLWMVVVACALAIG